MEMITNLFIRDSSDIPNQTISSQLVSEKLNGTPLSKLPITSRIINSWTRWDLRRKATIIALAIGIVPMILVGGVAHHLASRSLIKQIIAEQESRTFELRHKISLMTNLLVGDATIIANSPLLNDPSLSEAVSVDQKVALLDNFIDAHQEKYDSIAVFDLKGNLLFQSKYTQPFDPQENYSDREHFQRAISTKATAVNNPELTPASSKNSLEVATPIKEKGTGKILGLVSVRMPLVHWEEIFQHSQLQGLEHNLIDSKGKIFAADETEVIGHDAAVDFVDIPRLKRKLQSRIDNGGDVSSIIESGIMKDINDREQVVVSLTTIPNISGILEPGWQIALSRPVEEAFAPLKQLRLTLLFGTTIAALVVGSIAAILARRATLPILEAAGTVKKIGKGDLNARLDIQGEDELAMLGTDINKMAKQLKSLVLQKELETRRSRILKNSMLKLAEAQNSQEVFQIAVAEIIPILKADRAIFYRQESNDRGTIVAEAVKCDHIPELKSQGTQLNYLPEYSLNGNSDLVKVINNIYQADLQLAHLKQLEALEVKSELSVPMFVDQQLQGFLVVQQCDLSRTWHQVEIDFLAQFASQVMMAKERTDLLFQQQADKEQLQKQAMELLMEVEPISQGDLTVRATVTEGEIGTLADSYNSTVESLRQIVTQVQHSVTQMAATTDNNGEIAQSLSDKAKQQSQAIALSLQKIQAMTESIQAVALHAEQVDTAFQDVSNTVAVGNMGMERTVKGIFAIRETVAETAKKVKRLGESSQKISKVVNLINNFADRTNLLALNASLEANRTGHEGQNFAIVAEEVQTLAQQSAAATTEIEKLVASIQLDTKEVATVMEQGTERVVAGTKLVNETRQKLNTIAASSTLVGDRLKKIATETVQQSLASQEISETIAAVAEIASNTSSNAIEVSSSTQKILSITNELQASANKFKV